ncbi:RNA ligase family protein [Streptomyces sp. MB09-01]|uniref:RNA ligase family protein n=1 Tax=Streptomyces sp. MB09-01 TaxID=3028666 RepID=UPI0029ABBAE6|nr:RNA ligase family protein [Streptomyces sp. MB09-01]MDX3534541.1 RNA ligase family protein [Streptomyces sp. MB09-01]
MHPEPRPWSPYPKIPANRRLGEVRGRNWVAHEKIHGANFAVVCDEAGAHPAKRRELLADAGLDEFFGVGRIWPALAVAATRCAQALRAECGAAASAVVTLYGELAGGHYPHPEVPPTRGAEPVQTGVWYAPDLLWLPFDATVADGDGLRWVADRTLRAAADGAGLVCVPLLAEGPIARVQELPAVFPTRLPGLLGLPTLPGNLAEGLVVKPAGETREPGRPMAKFKQPAFAEDERFDGSRPYQAPAEGAAGVPGWLLAQATGLLTPARAASAVSKLGPRTPPGDLAAEIARDATEEVAEALGGLDGATRRALEDSLHAGALSLARFDAADRRL